MDHHSIKMSREDSFCEPWTINADAFARLLKIN